jgi:hypothetical protein
MGQADDGFSIFDFRFSILHAGLHVQLPIAVAHIAPFLHNDSVPSRGDGK